MDASALASAESWLSIIGSAKLIAAFLVALGVVIEFGGDWVAKPFEKTIEDARKLELGELHKQSDEAKRETARLSAEAETARKETAQAKLELEQLRAKVGPRNINATKFLEELSGKPTAPVEILFPKENGEAFGLAMQFRDLLRTAGWTVPEPKPIPPNEIPRVADQPSHMAAGGQPTGVAVAVRADTQEEMRSFSASLNVRPGFPFNSDLGAKSDPALAALYAAIIQSVGEASAHIGGANSFNTPAKGTFRIIVGPKP